MGVLCFLAVLSVARHSTDTLLPAPTAPSDQVIIFDAAGKSPECVETTHQYGSECLIQVNMLSYYLAERDVIRVGKCTDLGPEWGLMGPDAFLNGTVYWRGGPTAFSAFWNNTDVAPFWQSPVGHLDWPLQLVKLWATTPACDASIPLLGQILAAPLKYFPEWPGTPAGLEEMLVGSIAARSHAPSHAT